MTTTSPLPTPRVTRQPLQGYVPNDPIAMKEAQLRAKIARLQAQQRRQKMIEDLERPKRVKSGGFRFIHAFLIVLGLHAAAIGGFYGFTTLKKMQSGDKTAQNEKAPVTAAPQAPESIKAGGSSSKDEVKTASKSSTKHHVAHLKKNRAYAASTPRHENVPSAESPKQEKEPTVDAVPKISPSVRALFARHQAVDSPAAPQPAKDGNASQGATEALASMGKHESPDSVPSPTVTAPHPNPPTPSSYTVAPGDTISRVASMMNVPAQKLREANGLGSGNSLQVGQKLNIPSEKVAEAPLQLVLKEPEETATPNKVAEAPKKFVPPLDRIAPHGIYTVQRGDNAYSIAHRLGVSFSELMTVNNINNPADVTIGMRLKVPSDAIAAN